MPTPFPLLKLLVASLALLCWTSISIGIAILLISRVYKKPWYIRLVVAFGILAIAASHLVIVGGLQQWINR